MNRSILGLLELIITAIIWGIAYTVLKIALNYYNSFEVAFLRFFVASIFFLPFIFFKKEKYTSHEYLILIILGATGVFAYQTFFIYGESGINAGAASFIVSTEPIFIYVLSLVLKDEKLRLYPILGITISTSGLMILIQPSDIGYDKGIFVFMIILSAIAWGVFTIAGKNILKRHNSLHVTAISSIFGAIMLFPLAGYGSVSHFIRSGDIAIISILFLGIFATFIGYLLWFDGLKYVRPSVAGATLYITPFITVFSAMLLIREPFTSYVLIGGSLIILGIALSNMGGIKG